MLLYLLPSAGKTPDAGPSSLYKKPEGFQEQFQNLRAEEATSLTPTILLNTALELAVSTEEPPVLPATSPRSQVKRQLLIALYPLYLAARQKSPADKVHFIYLFFFPS